jgi:hypothetical protein
MSPKLKKILLLLLAAAMLAGSSTIQRSLNGDREKLDLTRVAALDNAPPVLAFTTIALGGFRGLIANMLWMRATQLQDDDKFFEMAQLSDWITKLEPSFSQVWAHEAWNMAYNISVKFPKAEDRWRWVERGIELLRDEGLKYNPNDTLIFRELAWIFQNKMGANLDDANMYYKREWSREMTPIFGENRTNFDDLITPQTVEQRERARLLVEKYKMDPQLIKEVNERYGPLEWRLPEAHAIYWAERGLKKAAENPTKIKPEDLIMLRRVIYQSMQLSFERGRLVVNPFVPFDLGPNLDIIPRANRAYEEAEEEDKPNREAIQRGHRNFVRNAVYYLYAHNRLVEAANWFKYLGTHYPDKPILDNQTNSFPRNLTLDEYAAASFQADINETMSRDRVKARLEDLLAQAYYSLILGQNDRAAGYELLTEKVLATYETKTIGSTNRIPMTPIPQLKQEVVNQLLDPEHGWPTEMRAALRLKLGLAAEPPATNAPPEKSSSQ